MTEKQEENKKTLERIVTFTDAVYAIALTLLVLELRLPNFSNSNSAAEMLYQLQVIGPKFSAFFLSALIIGGNWTGSVHLQRAIVRTDQGYTVYVVINLIIMSLLPFCCNLIGSFPNNPMSFVVFAIVNGLFMINGYFIYNHLIRNKLFDPQADLFEIKKVHKAISYMFLFMIVIGGIAFISTRISFILFLFWGLFPFFLVNRKKIKDKV